MHTSSLLLRTEYWDDKNITPSTDMENLVRGNADGVLTNGAAWAWDSECQKWGVEFDGDNDHVNFGNLLLSGRQCWIHLVGRFDLLSHDQVFAGHVDTGGLVFYVFGLNGNNFGWTLSLAGGLYAYETGALTTGYHVIDGTINIASATGLRVYIDGVEISYDNQDDPTGISNLGLDGDFYFGYTLGSWHGACFKGIFASYAPDSTIISQLAAIEMRRMGI